MTTAKAKATAAAAAAPVAAAPLAANDAAKNLEQAVTAGKDTIEQVVKASQSAASKGYEKAVALTKEQVDAAVKAQTAAFRSYEDVVASTKENIEAVVKASQTLTAGLQEIGKSVYGLTQQAVEDSVAAGRQILATKSLRDAVDLQSALAKNHLDRVLSESTRLGDQTVKLFEEAFAPVQARVNAAVDRLVKRHH